MAGEHLALNPKLIYIKIYTLFDNNTPHNDQSWTALFRLMLHEICYSWFQDSYRKWLNFTHFGTEGGTIATLQSFHPQFQSEQWLKLNCFVQTNAPVTLSRIMMANWYGCESVLDRQLIRHCRIAPC